MTKHPKYHGFLTLGLFIVCAAHEVMPAYEHLIAICVNIAWLYEPSH